MTFQENFITGERSSTGPAGSFHPGIYVDTSDIEALIGLLGPYFSINRHQSKKIYSYGEIGLEEHSTSVKRLKGYLLKSDDLEIRLENQRSLKIGPEKLTKSTNNCKRITSIKCEVSSLSEKGIEELIVQKISEKIRDFYNRLPNERLTL